MTSSVSSALDYRKNPGAVLDRLKSLGANVSESGDKLRELVTHIRCKRKSGFQNKKPETPFQEIEFGTKLKEIPKCYLSLVLNFVGYLASTSSYYFHVKGRKLSSGEDTEQSIPYIHRWTETYRKSIIAKLYQLESVIGAEHSVTMITLTVHQRGMDPVTCLNNLKRAYRALMDVLRHTYGTTDYFWILEPHKTGYAHMHLIYWRVLSEAEQKHICNLWERKYQAGKEGVGVAFSLPSASKDGGFKAGTIAKVRSYLMKYLSKGLYKKYEPAEILFNAVLWKSKSRLWGCSRNFSKIMKPEIEEPENWECLEVWKCDNTKLEEPALIWSKELKKSGLLGSGKSLVDCEKETSHHSVYTKPRSVTMKKYDEWLLCEIRKPVIAPFWVRVMRSLKLINDSGGG